MAKKLQSGSNLSRAGGLRGATDTDYFYFFCPKCKDDEVMRVLAYQIRENSSENPYNDQFKKKASGGFTIAFDLYCEKCKHEDLTKISNTGLQGGTHIEALRRLGA